MSKRLTAAIAAVLGTAALASGVPPAMGANSHEPESGTPQCHGQAVAAITQIGAEEGIHGIGKVTMAIEEVLEEEVTVKQLQAAIRELCTAEPEP